MNECLSKFIQQGGDSDSFCTFFQLDSNLDRNMFLNEATSDARF